MIAPSLGSSEKTLRSCAIACLRAPYDPEAAAEARGAFSDPVFDWPAFVRFIHNERVSPLIHYLVGSWDLFPADAAESIRRAYLQNAWLNDLRLEELRNILDHLQAAGIPVVLLKGAALIHTLYEKSALRPMSDMDLLVLPEDMQKAQQVLLLCGYAYVIASSIPKEFESEVAFQKSGPCTWLVEIHSSLLIAPHRLSDTQSAWFWNSKVKEDKNGREVWVFDLEAQLLHLSAHLWLHHGGGDLLGMNDIYQLIRQNQGRIDWDKVLVIGKAFEFLLPLQHVLPEAAANWKAPVPGDVLFRLAQMQPSLREKRKFNKFWGEDQNYAETLVSGTMSYPDWKSRFRYARLIIFPPAKYIQERYQVQKNWMIPYYYFYRLASRAAQQVNRIFKKTPRSIQ